MNSNLIKFGNKARGLLGHTAVRIIPNVITLEQEEDLMKEIDPVMSRRRYARNHWDDVIIGYKEIERLHWTSGNNAATVDFIRNTISDAIVGDKKVVSRIHSGLSGENGATNMIALDDIFGVRVRSWLPVHIIDLSSDGFITPHVDSVKFSGHLVCGLSLLTSSIMTLRPEDPLIKDDQDACVKMLLPRRSLYILSAEARYNFTHSIEASNPSAPESPHAQNSVSQSENHERGRRVSLIFRDAKDP
jgi:alkylated DNA repair protein alkB homolog 7